MLYEKSIGRTILFYVEHFAELFEENRYKEKQPQNHQNEQEEER
jgi:hypothetical protein